MKSFFVLTFFMLLFLGNSKAQSIVDCHKEIKQDCSALNPSEENKIIYCLNKKSNIIQSTNPLCFQYIKNKITKMQNDCALEIRKGGCIDNFNSNNSALYSCLLPKKDNAFIVSNPSCSQVLNDILKEILEAQKQNKTVPSTVFSRIAIAPVPSVVMALPPEKLAEQEGQKVRLKNCSKFSKEKIYRNCLTTSFDCGPVKIESLANELCRPYSEMKLNSEIRMCIDDVMGNLKNKVSNNEYYYYIVESYKLCRPIIEGAGEQKKCFFNRKKKSFYHAENEYERCDPKIIKCLDAFNRVSSSFPENSKRDEIYFYYCKKYKNELSEEPFECMAEMLNKGEDFLKNYVEVARTCKERSDRDCIDRFIKLNKTENLSFNQYKNILSLCEKVKSLNKDNTWADCVYQSMAKNQITLEEASSQCNQVSERARKCLNKCSAKNINNNICREEICGYTSTSIQDCLIELKTPHSKAIGPKEEGAFWFCSLENKEQKACFLEQVKKAKKDIKKDISKGELQYFATSCRKEHKDFALCLDEYTDYFQKYRSHPFATKELGHLICEIPIESIRHCLLDSLMARGEKQEIRRLFSFDRAYDNCHRHFLTNLITQFQDEGRPQWSCRYTEFENKSLFEQNKECLKIQSKICVKFEQEILPTSGLEALKKECPLLKNLKAGSQGPLEKECRKRGLWP